MRLYSITTSERESRPAKKGGNEYIDIELYHGNNKVKHLRFQIEKGTGGYNWELLSEDDLQAKADEAHREYIEQNKA